MIDPMDVAGRADRVRASLAAAESDALLVTDLTNIRWLTGFTGSAARVALLADELVLVTDGRYGDQAAEQLAAAGVAGRVEVGTLAGGPARASWRPPSAPPRRLGLEAASVSWADQRRYTEWFPDAALVPTAGVVEAERLVKDPGEIDRIETACAIAGDALLAVLPAAGRRARRDRLRPRPRQRDAPAGRVGPQLRDDRGRRPQRRPAPPPPRRPPHPGR